jgi:hypothetical protein
MSHSLAVDILSYSKNLQKVGFTQEQAEVQAQFIAKAIDDTLATKQDIKESENKLELKMAELKSELIKWVLGVSTAQAAIIISCIKFIH